jgi:PIN domain nuclease of toxin-antitoxin system
LPGPHKDPFDRLLIAQSLSERLPVVTLDAVFARYGAETVWD